MLLSTSPFAPVLTALLDAAKDTGRVTWAYDLDHPKAPTYFVKGAANFLDRTPSWLRTLHLKDKLWVGERRVSPARDARNHRVYTLADLEDVALALVQAGSWDGQRYAAILLKILATAEMHTIPYKERSFDELL